MSVNEPSSGVQWVVGRGLWTASDFPAAGAQEQLPSHRLAGWEAQEEGWGPSPDRQQLY